MSGKEGGATTKGGRGKPKASKSVSRWSKAGFKFPVGRIARFLKTGKYSPVYLSAVLEYLAAEYVPFGGPSGGDGGRGGNVYVEVNGAMNSLLPFRNCVHFRAGRGSHGQGSNQHGAKGEDVVVKIAPGTVIREARDDGSEGQLLLELLHPRERALLLPWGRGGRGNAAFKSGLNKVPRIAENGEEGPEM